MPRLRCVVSLILFLCYTWPGVFAHPVERYVGRWHTAPKQVPGTVRQPDGPIAGNGDFGITVGGGRECCGGTCCVPGRSPTSVAHADLAWYFGKNDFWVNGPQVIHHGQSYSHASPGFVTLQVGSEVAGDRSSPRPFNATQELANGRVNASAGLGPEVGGTLQSSAFVARDSNVAVIRFWLEGTSVTSVPAKFTLSTPNHWAVPSQSGLGRQNTMWLRKDASNTVQNALTLTPCSKRQLVYDGIRTFRLSHGELRVQNGTVELCLDGQAPLYNHTASPALGPSDAWFTTRNCSEIAHAVSGNSSIVSQWRLVGDKVTDGGGRCMTYAGVDVMSAKVVMLPCNASMVSGQGNSWAYDSATQRLRAVNLNDPHHLFDGGACLTAVPPNVNVSVALVAQISDENMDVVAPMAPASCDGLALCHLDVELHPRKTYFLLVACMTQRDTEWKRENIDAVQALIAQISAPAGVVAAESSKNRFWAEFWARSSVDLPGQPDIEGWYYGMLYLVASSYALGKVATSHYGVFNVHDNPQCIGQLTLNYNTVAINFGLGSGNRVELMRPIVDELSREDLYEYGRQRASMALWPTSNRTASGRWGPFGTATAEMGCTRGQYEPEDGCPGDFGNFSGIELPCACGPYPGMFNSYDCAQRSNAGLTVTAFIDYYEYSLDRSFLRDRLWKWLAGVADFYSTYGKQNAHGQIELPYTCPQEMCAERQGGYGPSHEDNALVDLSYARLAVLKLQEYSSVLGRAIKPEWTDLLERLVPFPTVERAGFGVGWAEATVPDGNASDLPPLGNTDYPIVYFAPIHPSGLVGLESSQQVLEYARNTVQAVNAANRWRPLNGFCLGWPSAGRIVGRDNTHATQVLESMAAAIRNVSFPNFWPNLEGGGLEQVGGLEAIHSMLLQSHESCLRLFPSWPENGSASFSHLRARGGMIVSASQLAGRIGEVEIISEIDRSIAVCEPAGWVGLVVTIKHSGAHVPTERNHMSSGPEKWRYTFHAGAGQSFLLSESTSALVYV